MQSFLGLAEEEITHSETLALKDASPDGDDSASGGGSSTNTIPIPLVALTPEEYFSSADLNGRDVGQPRKINSKVSLTCHKLKILQ